MKQLCLFVTVVILFSGLLGGAAYYYNQSPVGIENTRICEVINKKLLLVKKGDAIFFGRAKEIKMLIAREDAEEDKITSVKVYVYGFESNVRAVDIAVAMRDDGFFNHISQTDVPVFIEEIIQVGKKFEKK